MTSLEGLTLRQLDDLAYGALMAPASQMALLANVYRDTKKQKKPFSPADFHPMETTTTERTRSGRGVPVTPSMIEALATAFDKLEEKRHANHTNHQNSRTV